jgi:glycosyltransferase involved in cell wall biosynthesis
MSPSLQQKGTVVSKSKPDIYIVIATFHPLIGGAERQAFLHANSLRERGYEATIITFRHDTTWAAREILEGVPVIRVAGSVLGKRAKLPRQLQQLLYLLAMLIMGWTLWQYRRHYTLLHIYQFTMLTLPVALVCRLTKKPLIISLRSASPDRKTQSSPQHPALLAGPLEAATPWLSVQERIRVGGDLDDLERFGTPILQVMRLLLSRLYTVVIILSSRMQSYLAAYDLPLAETALIPNGVDITRFHPRDNQTLSDQQTPTVVCVSTLRYEKGIDVLLQAWHLVHRRMPQARLILVGDGPLRPQLVLMIEALGITDTVEFVGTQSDVPAQLHRGDIAVLPSRREGMPNAVLEAMACGLPCVATRVSGSEDIIQHGVNGMLVEPEAYQEMAQALLTLLHNPRLSQEYGYAARATIEKNYALERIAERYTELYQRAAEWTQSPPGNALFDEREHVRP